MTNIKKNLAVAFLVFATLIASVFAGPVNVADVNIQEVNNDYMVVITLSNVNIAAGETEQLSFTIKELGTTKNLGYITIDTNSKVFTYNLRDLTDSYDLLTKGNTYQLTVSTTTDNMTEAFLFGNEQTTDGLGLILENVEVNNEELVDADLLQVMNGETLTVDLRFSAQENFDDARIMVFIDGYEHSTLVASTDIFSVKTGTTYIKSVSLNLPSDMNTEKEYKLRIVGANDLSGITYRDYSLYVDTQRHRVDIVDLVMTPSSGVEPGQNIIANIRLKNRGQKSQDSVKVIISVPDLGIEESSYVSNLNSQEVVTSDDMLLFVSKTAAAGQHEAIVTLSYDNGYTLSTQSFTLNILAPQVISEKNLLVSFKNNIDLSAGNAKTFEVVVANPNDESKPISLSIVDNTWADVEVTPTLAMVKGGDSNIFTVTVTPKSAIAGEKELTLSVKEGSKLIDEIKVNTYVASSDSGINWVNVALAVLLVIAIIILLSLVISIAKRRNDDDDEDNSSTEEYY